MAKILHPDDEMLTADLGLACYPIRGTDIQLTDARDDRHVGDKHQIAGYRIILSNLVGLLSGHECVSSDLQQLEPFVISSTVEYRQDQHAGVF